MAELIDFWNAEDFENTVAGALIACYETKVKKNKGAPPCDRLTDERIAVIRKMGPYIASGSRLIDFTKTNNGGYTFDLVNDKLPVSGCFAFPITPGSKIAQETPSGYMQVYCVRQVDCLGKNWHRRGPGALYEMFSLTVEQDGIDGERQYFTVNASGEVQACTQMFQHSAFGNRGRMQTISQPEEWLNTVSAWGSVSLQFLADRRFCWTITAEEKDAKVHIGSMREEIKSLLYARSLPMTETGRKRPILHLVEAHKRRMRNGTDIDIAGFLRGQQVVEMGGTRFTVEPPKTLQSDLSINSQRKYYGQEVA